MTILDRLIAELRSSPGPVSVSTLSRRLAIDSSALDGMLATLTATGALVGDSPTGGDPIACAGASSCAVSCTGIDRCAFIVSAPRTLSLPTLAS